MLICLCCISSSHSIRLVWCHKVLGLSRTHRVLIRLNWTKAVLIMNAVAADICAVTLPYVLRGCAGNLTGLSVGLPPLFSLPLSAWRCSRVTLEYSAARHLNLNELWLPVTSPSYLFPLKCTVRTCLCKHSAHAKTHTSRMHRFVEKAVFFWTCLLCFMRRGSSDKYVYMFLMTAPGGFTGEECVCYCKKFCTLTSLSQP